MDYNNRYEDEIQEQILMERRREHRAQLKKRRRFKRRMHWVFTRIVPFCLVCMLLLTGVVFGIRGIVLTVCNHISTTAEDGSGKQSQESGEANENAAGADATADADNALTTEASEASDADQAGESDPGSVITFEDETIGGNDGALEEGEDLDEVPSDIEEMDAPYFAVKTDFTTTLQPDVLAERGIVIDPESHTILADKNGTVRIVPASMTKVLTLLVAVEHIKSLDDTFTITAEIGDYAHQHDLSIVGFSEGEVVTVKDLLYGTILPSGGDAAIALATYVAGSEDAFVDLMNKKLKELGLSKTSHMTNCVGLFDDSHYSTCYDIAMIMQAALDNELCRNVLTEHKYMTGSTEQHPDGIEISNWFLRRIEDKDCGGTVLYAKTGYVKQSGYCAVSYAVSTDGKPLICVTTNSGSSWKCIYDHVRIYSDYFKLEG